MPNDRLYIISWDEEGLADTAIGKDRAAAVVDHYATMDMYCSPDDPDMREVFSVTVYEVPTTLEDTVRESVEGLTGDEIFAYVEKLADQHPEVDSRRVDVVYTMDGADATEADRSPRLFAD